MRLASISMVLFLLLSVGVATDEIIFTTIFDSDNFGGKASPGAYKLTENGLYLTADSHITFSIPKARAITDGRIEFSFITPDLDPTLIPIMIESEECFCALKLRIGRGEIEFSEKWLRVQQYGSNLKQVEKILVQLDRDIQTARMEMKAIIEIKNNLLSVSVNGQKMLTVENFIHDFKAIVLSSYKKYFDILNFSVATPHSQGYSINKEKKEIDLVAVFRPSQFNTGEGLQNHHYIVWESGNAVKNALFTTFISDSLLHEALVSVGGKPGNNLTQDTWTKRRIKKSTEPDKRAKGSVIGISVIYGTHQFTPAEILHELNNRAINFKFAGNLDLIPQWHSGCIACLQSCPGGKIGNATYSIRDLEKGIPKFSLKTGLPFREGEKVLLRFAVR